MKDRDGLVQAYNAQAALEPTCQLTVGQTLTNEANDKRQLQPLVKAVERQAGQRPTAAIVRMRTCSIRRRRRSRRKGIEAWLATQKTKHNEPPAPPLRGRIPRGLTRVERMKRKLSSRRAA